MIAFGCAPAGPIPSAPKVAGAVAMGTADRPVSPITSTAWFPYARRDPVPEAIAAPVAIAAKAMLAQHLPELDICLAGKVGSVSAMLDIATDGTITARVGGIGHRPTEDCIAEAVGKLRLPGGDQPVELECGLSSGAAGPLRVAIGAGYRRVDVEKDIVHVEGIAQALDGNNVAATRPHDDDVYLVISTPDVSSERLEGVLHWLVDVPAVLVAVKADGGPPVFLAMGPDRRPFHSPSDPRVQIQLDAAQMVACLGRHSEAAVSLLVPKTVDAALRGAIAGCGSACDEVVEVGGGHYVAKDLVAATSAVRRAGLDPVMVLGPRCP